MPLKPIYERQQLNCAECQQPYLGYRAAHRFCSKRCRNQFHAKQRKRIFEFGKQQMRQQEEQGTRL